MGLLFVDALGQLEGAGRGASGLVAVDGPHGDAHLLSHAGLDPADDFAAQLLEGDGLFIRWRVVHGLDFFEGLRCLKH